MKNISFKLWLFESEEKPSSSNSDWPGAGWVPWKVTFDDKSRPPKYKKGDWVWFNPTMSTGNKIKPVQKVEPTAQPIVQPIAQQPAQPVQSTAQYLNGKWIWAKSLGIHEEYGMPAKDLDLAISQKNPNEWIFVILDTEEGRLVSRGTIPNSDIDQVVQKQKSSSSQFIKADKPSDLLKVITPKKEISSKKTIPNAHITDEQKEIDKKFEDMLSGKDKSHMIINALAGSGKTTMLKHLAWKYVTPTKKWLYLVFNAINQREAVAEFPRSIEVKTTNSWAGGLALLDNPSNKAIATDRIVAHAPEGTKLEKAKMLADTPDFYNLTKTLGIPPFANSKFIKNDNARILQNTKNDINKTFKMEVVKLLGLLKSNAIDPKNDSELDKNIKDVMKHNSIDSFMRDIKDLLIKRKNLYVNEGLDNFFGLSFHNKNFEKEIVEAVKWLLHQSLPHEAKSTFINNKSNQIKLGSVRDFDDDLWFAAIHADELEWPKYDVVLADEVQDFNVSQQIILKKLADNGAKIVAVGDPHQAVYRFRGADNESFSKLKDTLETDSAKKDIEKSLTSNFRSRQAVVDMSNDIGREKGHVDNLIKGRDFKETPGKIGKGSATDGKVEYEDAFNTINKEMEDMGEIKETAFLSRTTEPLLHAALRLMSTNVPFVILGKDLGKELIKHIEKIFKEYGLNKYDTCHDLYQKIYDHNEEEHESNSHKAAMTAKLKELKETTDALLGALQNFNPQAKIDQFMAWLKENFGGLELEKTGPLGDRDREEFKEQKKKNPVILSTVHKSKGLQFQRVYILRNDLWPHPRVLKHGNEADLAQEHNNQYIALTRAEDELHILALKGQPGVKEGRKLGDF